MDMTKMGAFLQALRKEQNLTQEQLGEKLHISSKTISRWETGASMPDIEMLQLLGQKFGVSINEILAGQRLSDEEFRQKVEASKGCCMHHLVPLLEAAGEHLPNSQREWFYTTLLRLLQENVVRVKGDIDWFCGMFDYRQAGKDWKNSRDAVSRGMQKLRGIYPADPPYKQDT